MTARSGSRGRDPLLRSAYSLGFNSILITGQGLVFWIVAARIYPSPSVGRDSALIATMTQISLVARLNMGNAIVRFLPGYRAGERLLLTAYATNSIAAALLATGFVLVAPDVSENFAFLTREPLTGAAYVAAVILWGVFTLQDAALVAVRQAPWVPLENGLYALLKLLALPLLFAAGSMHGIFTAWVTPIVLLIVPVNWLIFRRFLIAHRAQIPGQSSRLPFGRRRLARFLAFDYLATLFAQAGLGVVPVLVVAVLSSRANAHFYIPFSIALALDTAFFSIATSLVAEGAQAPSRVPALIRLLILRGSLIVLPLVGVLIVAAPLVMRLFGEEYVRASTSVLRIVLVASLFRAVVALVGAKWRLDGTSGRIAALDGCMFFGVVSLTVPLAHALGVLGVALAWLGPTMLAGCVGLPPLIRAFRLGGNPTHPSPHEGARRKMTNAAP